MSWYNWQTQKKQLEKEAALHGEWWIMNGSAEFADGDVGDYNHIGMAMEMAQREVLSDLDVIVDEPDWEAEKEKLCQQFLNVLQSNPDVKYVEALQDVYSDDPDQFFWDNICKPNGISSVLYGIAEEKVDVRASVMENWGHKRMVRNVVETYSLTLEDLQSITSGIDDAYGSDIEMAEDQGRELTFTLEVDSTRSLYIDIPVNVLFQNNVAALAPYRERY